MVVRPEDIDIVPVEQGQITGTVTDVTFKGMQYDIIVDFQGFKWLIQTTDHSPVGAKIGVKGIDPDSFHIMKRVSIPGFTAITALTAQNMMNYPPPRTMEGRRMREHTFDVQARLLDPPGSMMNFFQQRRRQLCLSLCAVDGTESSKKA